MANIQDLADVIRSKAVGPFKFTLDIIFKDHETFDKVVRSGVIAKELIAALYRVDVERITDFVLFRPGKAIKITMLRPVSAGGFGDGDVLASQQHGPLYHIRLPIEEG